MSLFRVHQAYVVTQVALFDNYSSSGILASDQANFPQAVVWFASAAAIPHGDPRREEANRIRLQSCLAAAPKPVGMLPHDRQVIQEMVFHPGGAHLLVNADKGRITLWNLEKEERVPIPGIDRKVSQAAFHPDGDWIVLGSPEGEVEVLRFPSWERVHRFSVPGGVNRLAFSRDGRYVAAAGQTIRVLDCRAREFAGSEIAPPGPVLDLVFSARGDRLVTVGMDQLARVYAVPAGAEARPLFEPIPSSRGGMIGFFLGFPTVIRPRFLDGDRKILTVLERSSSSSAALWDAETGKRILDIDLGEYVTGTASSEDGRCFALLSSKAQVWDSASPSSRGPCMEHPAWVRAMAFSPDGSVFLTAATDRVVRLWASSSSYRQDPFIISGPTLLSAIPHGQDVHLVTFSPDGRFFAAAQTDGLLRIWQMPRTHEADRVLDNNFGSFELSPDGAHLMSDFGASAVTARNTRGSGPIVVEMATGASVGPGLRHEGRFRGGTFSPDGLHALTLHAARDSVLGILQFWEWRSGRRVFRLELPAPAIAAAYYPGGKLVAVLLADGRLCQIDAEGGKILKEGQPADPGRERNQVGGGLRFAPGGDSFISWMYGEPIKIWETSTGEPREPGLEEDLPCAGACFTADGKYLATFWGDAVQIWDHGSGRRRSALLRHPAALSQAEFSPDGRLLLTVSSDRRVRIWEWEDARLLCPPLEHEAEVTGAGFVPPAGSWIVTASKDNRFRIWEWLTGRPLAPVRPFFGEFVSTGRFLCRVTPDGRYAVANNTHEIRIFGLAEMDASKAPALGPEALRTLGEIMAGKTIHPGGGVANLSTSELLERWGAFRKEHPKSFDYDPSRGASLEWHRGRAMVWERERQFDAALWHLDCLGGAASRDDRLRRARIEGFVRDWRFSDLEESWTGTNGFVSVDGKKLEAILASAASARLLRSSGPYIDFADRFRPRINDRTGYAVRTIACERERRVKILVGRDDALRVWLNGEIVLQVLSLGGAIPDTDEADLRLVAGENTLVVEVSNAGSKWGLYFRFVDEEGRRLRLTEEGRLEVIEAPE